MFSNRSLFKAAPYCVVFTGRSPLPGTRCEFSQNSFFVFFYSLPLVPQMHCFPDFLLLIVLLSVVLSATDIFRRRGIRQTLHCGSHRRVANRSGIVRGGKVIRPSLFVQWNCVPLVNHFSRIHYVCHRHLWICYRTTHASSILWNYLWSNVLVFSNNVLII